MITLVIILLAIAAIGGPIAVHDHIELTQERQEARDA